MKTYLRSAAALAALCVTTHLSNLQAAEVILNESTLAEDGSTAVVIERQQGPYVAAWLGVAGGASATTSGGLKGAELQDGNGFAAGLKLGYYYQTPFFVRPSIELEVAYLNSEFNVGGNLEGRDGGRFAGGSDLQALVGTVNLVLALDLGAVRDQVGDFLAGFHPYIGVGAGAGYSSLEAFEGNVKGQGDGKNRKLRVDGGSKIDFAYQLMAGLEIDLDEDVSIFGEFKHMSLGGAGGGAVSDYQRDLWVFGCKLAY